MTLGPLEFIVIAFPDERVDPKVVDEFVTVVEGGAVTIVDLLIVRKDAAGEISVDEFDVGDAGAVSLSEKLDLISAEDAEAVGEGLAPETCAAIIVFEQTWAKAFAHAVGAVGGQVAIRLPIPYDIAEAAAAALGVDA